MLVHQRVTPFSAYCSIVFPPKSSVHLLADRWAVLQQAVDGMEDIPWSDRRAKKVGKKSSVDRFGTRIETSVFGTVEMWIGT